MTTDTLGQPSDDARPVPIPGWRRRPGSTPEIHREADSCDRVLGEPCVRLELPAGLVAELGLVAETREVAPESDEGSQAGNYSTEILPGRQIGDSA